MQCNTCTVSCPRKEIVFDSIHKYIIWYCKQTLMYKVTVLTLIGVAVTPTDFELDDINRWGNVSVKQCSKC